MPVDFYDLVVGTVLRLRNRAGPNARTWPIPLDRRAHADALMRAPVVVKLAPALELRLRLAMRHEGPPGQHFGLQRAMKPLILAVRLRVIRTAVTHPNPQSNQPDGQLRQLAELARCAPRRAVIGVDLARQPVSGERPFQMGLHSGCRLERARLQHHVEARMVIEHGQRMAPAFAHGSKVALEIHLPQLVGLLTLEALPGGGIGRCSRRNPVVAMQNPGNRAGGRRRHRRLIAQEPGDLARAPGGVARAHAEHVLLKRGRGDRWRVQRPAGLIGQSGDAIFFISIKPFVAGLAAHTEASAQIGKGHALMQSEFDELLAQFHGVSWVPRHGRIRGSWTARKCQPCLRTPVSYVSGLNTTATKKRSKENASQPLILKCPQRAVTTVWYPKSTLSE